MKRKEKKSCERLERRNEDGKVRCTQERQEEKEEWGRV